MRSYKNRTAILFDENRVAKAWGYEAEKLYSKKVRGRVRATWALVLTCRAALQRRDQKWVLLENFKMRLMEDDTKNPALIAPKRKKPYVRASAVLCVVDMALCRIAKLSAPAAPLDVSFAR